MAAIHLRFGLPAKPTVALEKLFKRADLISAYHEATQLAGFEPDEARKIFGAPPAALKTPRLTPLPTGEAQELFLERFRKLSV